MSRLSKRLGHNQPIDSSNYQRPEEINYQPENQDINPQELEEYYNNLRQQRMQLQMQKKQQMNETNYAGEYGDTKNPNIIATEIENQPSPKGTVWMNIGGRPIDLHELEDYLVWKTSPFVMKTLMRYHNAKTMEDIKNYSRGGRPVISSRFAIMLILCIGMAVIGVVMLFFMPQILGFFKGGI